MGEYGTFSIFDSGYGNHLECGRSAHCNLLEYTVYVILVSFARCPRLPLADGRWLFPGLRLC